MIYIFLLILLIVALIIPHKSSYNNMRLSNFWIKSFILIWVVLISISLTNPFELYRVSMETYTLLIIFVVSFFLGFSTVTKKSELDYEFIHDRLFESITNLNKNKIYLTFNFLVLLICLYYAYKYIGNLSLISSSEMRTSRYEVGNIFSSIYELLIFSYMVGSFIWFSKFLVAFGLVFGAKKFKLIFYMNLVLCLSYLSFGGGRNILIEIAIISIFLNIVHGILIKSKNLKKNGKLLTYISISIFLFAITTFFRMVDEQLSLSSFIEALSISFEHVIVYAVGSFRALDYSINNLSLERGYGAYTLSALNEVYNMALRLLGFDTLPFSQKWGEILADQIYISNDIRFNALYTAVFNFYNDFGIFGVILFPFIWGRLSSKSVDFFINKGDLFSLFISAMLFMSTLLSCLIFKLTPANFVIALLIAFFVSKFRFARNV